MSSNIYTLATSTPHSQLSTAVAWREKKFKRFVFNKYFCLVLGVQWNLDLRKPDLRKNLDLRKIVGTTDFLVHKLFDLRKIF